jgi:hypothetical protein
VSHLIDRTSPKGEAFAGTCRYCREGGLPMSAVALPCPSAPAGNQPVLDALDPPMAGRDFDIDGQPW